MDKNKCKKGLLISVNTMKKGTEEVPITVNMLMKSDK